RAAGLEVAHFDAIERLALARLDELVLDHGVRIAVEQDFETPTDLAGGVAGHFLLALGAAECVARLKGPRMITASPAPRQPRRWQDDMAAAITAPEALVADLGLPPELIPPAREASRVFAVRVPQSFVRRMRHGDPSDPLLLQVLPLAAEL